MRQKTEKWPDHLSDHRGNDRPEPNPEHKLTHAGFGAGKSYRAQPGKGTKKRKLEDLNDREDLSERIFTDRNWL